MGLIIRKGIQYGGSSDSAQKIKYDNATSGLSATNAQEAIDELSQNTPNSSEIEYDNSTSGLTATTVKDALDELTTKGIDESVFEEITDEELDAIIETDVSSVAMIYTYDTDTSYSEEDEMLVRTNVTSEGV